MGGGNRAGSARPDACTHIPLAEEVVFVLRGCTIAIVLLVAFAFAVVFAFAVARTLSDGRLLAFANSAFTRSASLRPRSTLTANNNAPPTRKRTERERTAGFEESKMIPERTKRRGPRREENFSITPKMPKNSPDFEAGDSRENMERDKACEPPCTTPTI